MTKPAKAQPRIALLAAAFLLVLAQASACGPPQHGNLDEEWARNADANTSLDGNLDKAEQRWRKEIAQEREQDEEDMRLLTDDPPQEPTHYGKVGSGEQTAEVAPEEPQTTWEKVKSGARTFGKASFSALTVLVTLGMIAAPYLLVL